MILSSKYIQILFLVLQTKSICQSSEVKIDNTEVVRQGVGSFETELILEEISQVWLNIDIITLFVIFLIAKTAHAPASSSRDLASPDFYGCGSCLSRLRIGDSGMLRHEH